MRRSQEISSEDASRVQAKDTLKDKNIKHIPTLNLFTSSFHVSLLFRTLSLSSTSRFNFKVTDHLHLLDDVGNVPLP